jgi:uncharacterized protein
MEHASVSQDALIAFLQNPSHYPYHPDWVKIVHTHASIVAIAPPYVFKIKKPVDLGFLDFRTLASRKANGEREMQLNSRLCQDLYVGLIPIYQRQGKISFEPGGEVLEYALQMKHLPEGYFLHELVAKGQVQGLTLEPVLQVLQQFYRQQSLDTSLLPYADIPHLTKNGEENLAVLEKLPPDMAAPEAVAAIRAYQQAFLTSHESLFQQRLREGRIKDGHGDLHLDHIHLHEGRVCIYDCIEFNDRFRYLDVAADIAFLVMDLDFHHRPDLAAYTANRFAALMHDPDLLLLLDFYTCYRACVRAKVEGIRAEQPEVPESERAESRKRVIRYLQLALRYALAGSRPVVFLVGGRIGSGKSTLARRLAQLLGMAYISGDAERKASAGLPLYARTSAQMREWLYSPEKTRENYLRLLGQAQQRVKQNQGVIVDATFGKKEHRAAFMESFARQKIPYYFIEAQASDGVIRARLQEREQNREVVSDARLDDFDTLSQVFEAMKEIPPANRVEVSTESGLDETMRNLLRLIAKKKNLF